MLTAPEIAEGATHLSAFITACVLHLQALFLLHLPPISRCLLTDYCRGPPQPPYGRLCLILLVHSSIVRLFYKYKSTSCAFGFWQLAWGARRFFATRQGVRGVAHAIEIEGGDTITKQSLFFFIALNPLDLDAKPKPVVAQYTTDLRCYCAGICAPPYPSLSLQPRLRAATGAASSLTTTPLSPALLAYTGQRQLPDMP
jgi:hypothetical protein